MPRGRVNCGSEFFLVMDKYILADTKALGKAMALLHLPGNTKVAAVDHYRCPRCLREKPTRKKEK
jgi:ubiquitin C-terminal hydrolase